MTNKEDSCVTIPFDVLHHVKNWLKALNGSKLQFISISRENLITIGDWKESSIAMVMFIRKGHGTIEA